MLFYIFLIISFLIGLPFVLLYYYLKKRRIKNKLTKSKKEINFDFSNLTKDIKDLDKEPKYKFMDDYIQWKNLSKKEKEERLMDIDVIMKHGKDGITKELIKQGFPIGTKIIDINNFSGLTEDGFTPMHFLLQHENGGEIREIGINIYLDEKKFVITFNGYYSSGKERYYYLKKKGLMKI